MRSYRRDGLREIIKAQQERLNAYATILLDLGFDPDELMDAA